MVVAVYWNACTTVHHKTRTGRSCRTSDYHAQHSCASGTDRWSALGWGQRGISGIILSVFLPNCAMSSGAGSSPMNPCWTGPGARPCCVCRARGSWRGHVATAHRDLCGGQIQRQTQHCLHWGPGPMARPIFPAAKMRYVPKEFRKYNQQHPSMSLPVQKAWQSCCWPHRRTSARAINGAGFGLGARNPGGQRLGQGPLEKETRGEKGPTRPQKPRKGPPGP